MRRHFKGGGAPECKNIPTDFSRRKYIYLREVQKCIAHHSKTVKKKEFDGILLKLAQAVEADPVTLIVPCVKDIIGCMFIMCMLLVTNNNWLFVTVPKFSEYFIKNQMLF